MKWIIFIFSLAFSYLFGFILNKGLSVANEIQGKETFEHIILYLYTIGINDMLCIISLTMTFYLFLLLFYRKSKASIKQLNNIEIKTIWIETIIFSFIMGTWFQSDLKLKYYTGLIEISDRVVLILFFMILLKIIILSFTILPEDDEENNEESDLYTSRKKLLPIIDAYLKTSNGFSIIGDWGIGKSKLIENFFKKERNEKGKYYREKYELIYIDTSKYSNNKKIIQELEIELNKILYKYKILKISEKIADNLFDSSISWLGKIKECIFLKNCLTDSKYMLEEKILELKKLEKEIVICLDNLERIDDKNRITNILAIVDDLTINEIKKIYVYDQNYMTEIFSPTIFDKYIDKYSCHTIRVEDVEIGEIIQKPEIIEMLKNKLTKRLKEILLEGLLEEKKEEIEEKLKIINKRLTNPRSVINLMKYIRNKENKFNEENQLEYKILIELFGKIDLNDRLQKLLFFPNMTYNEKIKLEVFQAIDKGEIELTNTKVESELGKIRENAFLGSGEDVLYYIRYCENNSIPEKIVELFENIEKYEINNIGNLYDFIQIMYKGINIKINKLNLKKNYNFFGSQEEYELQYSIYLLKVILIKKKLVNFKRISRIMFKNFIEYEELYEKPPIYFEEKLEQIMGMSLEEFIQKLKNIVISGKNKNFIEIFDYNMLIKEFELLDRVSCMEEGREVYQTKITKESMEPYIKKGIFLKDILIVNQDNIKILLKSEEITEVVDKNNIEEYKKIFFNMKEEGELIKDILLEIYLLEKRIKNVKK